MSRFHALDTTDSPEIRAAGGGRTLPSYLELSASIIYVRSDLGRPEISVGDNMWQRQQPPFAREVALPLTRSPFVLEAGRA